MALKLLAGIIATAVVAVTPAQAIPIDGEPPPCAHTSTGSLRLSSRTVTAGSSTTFTWSYNPSAGCTATVVSVLFRDALTGTVADTGIRGRSGSATVWPASNGYYFLHVFLGFGWFDFGSESVTIGIPEVNGRPTIEITRNDQATLFVQAVRLPNAIVRIAGNVELNMSYMDHIRVAAGVQIIGVRTQYPRGPRLFTTTFPRSLLDVGGRDEVNHSDNVRITGIRFDGGESSDPCDSAGGDYPYADAISVQSSLRVEIDHNEMLRWRGAGVVIYDADNVISQANPGTVWVHDNYIHDNQHPTYCGWNPFGSGLGGGYGVYVNQGARALIERNVFDQNRHAITGNGNPGEGYLLYRNLFLRPGVDNVKAWSTQYNHQIDMHGLTKDCPGFESYACGPAGDYMDVGWNTVVAASSDAIQLRGTPSDPRGMSVHNNVFGQIRSSALTQTETGLHDDGGNIFSAFDPQAGFRFPADPAATCDFDGDGANDRFWATGVTWWYMSSLVGHWHFLNQSSFATRGEKTLSDVNHDGLCDVTTPNGWTFLTPHDNRGPIGTLAAPPMLPTSWTAVEGGGNHSCGISWGTVWCWGANSEGQLGNGSRNNSVKPLAVAIPTAVDQIAVGRMHSCALESDVPSHLYCWGNNAYGQLGDGTTTTPRLLPVQVSGGMGWKSVTTGDWHTCGVRSDGSLWCWGFNTYGQLGDGTTTYRPQPVRVGTQTGWVSVRAGGGHTCATRVDGSLWCWGRNNLGQIGDGTTVDRLVPKQVAGNGWTGVSAGFQHTCGTRSDATLWCWGWNGHGQLGDGSGVSRSVPVRAGSGLGFAQVAAGYRHTCAANALGQAYCWGNNGVGQVGDGTLTVRLQPKQVSTGTVASIAVGFDHSCAVAVDSTLSCWGFNGSGQDGDGTTANLPTPTYVSQHL